MRHGVASVRQRVENLKTYLDPSRIDSVEQLETYLVDYFCDGEILLGENDVREMEEKICEYELYI